MGVKNRKIYDFTDYKQFFNLKKLRENKKIVKKQQNNRIFSEKSSGCRMCINWEKCLKNWLNKRENRCLID